VLFGENDNRNKDFQTIEKGPKSNREAVIRFKMC